MDDTIVWIDPATNQTLSRTDTRPYYFITIQVEKYIVDKAEEYPPVLTFRDPYVEGIFFIKGQKVDWRTEQASQYTIGERAIFFLARSDDNHRTLEASGFMSKFVIDENTRTAQSKYLEKVSDTKPRKLVDFEKEINEALAKSAR